MASRVLDTDQKKPKIHIRSSSDANGKVTARCNAIKIEVEMVEAALESDCDDCRATIMVGPVGQKGCELRPRTNHIPSPIEIGFGRNKD